MMLILPVLQIIYYFVNMTLDFHSLSDQTHSIKTMDLGPAILQLVPLLYIVQPNHITEFSHENGGFTQKQGYQPTGN